MRYWDSEEASLIQVVVGNSIEKEGTSADTRGFLGRVLESSPAPKPGDLLVQNTKKLHTYLEQQNVIFPGVRYTDSDDINSHGACIYYGFEEIYLENTSAEEILNVLYKLAIKYSETPYDIGSLQTRLGNALDHVSKDEYTQAFQEYTQVYFWASIQDFLPEAVKAISDFGCIYLKNARLEDGRKLLSRATALANHSKMLDPNIRAQVLFNTGVSQRLMGDFGHAEKLHSAAIYAAYHCGNSAICLMSLVELAGIHYMVGYLQKAVNELEQAVQLSLSQNNTQAKDSAIRLQAFVIEIQKEIQNGLTRPASEKQNLSAKFLELGFEVLKAVVKIGVEAFLIKRFGIPSGAIAITIWGDARSQSLRMEGLTNVNTGKILQSM